MPAASQVSIPNVVLVSHEGQPRRFYDDLVRGRTVVVQFFFTECSGVCPLSTGRMLALQEALAERLGRDVDFLSITLDPEHDTPEVLAGHARAIGARPGWTFLTGAPEDIRALRYRLGVYDLDPLLDADRNQHAGVLVFGNDNKQRWLMKPASLSPRPLLAALERLAAP
jgi:protein SCO1/2